MTSFQKHSWILVSFYLKGSPLNHTTRDFLTPVTKGVRKSLVVWFSGEPFK
jgi:hypothetical protein